MTAAQTDVPAPGPAGVYEAQPITAVERPAASATSAETDRSGEPLAFGVADHQTAPVGPLAIAAVNGPSAERTAMRTSAGPDGSAGAAKAILVQVAASDTAPRLAATGVRAPGPKPRAALTAKRPGRAPARTADTGVEDILSLPALNVSL